MEANRWTPEIDVALFRALHGHKPVGETACDDPSPRSSIVNSLYVHINAHRTQQALAHGVHSAATIPVFGRFVHCRGHLGTFESPVRLRRIGQSSRLLIVRTTMMAMHDHIVKETFSLKILGIYNQQQHYPTRGTLWFDFCGTFFGRVGGSQSAFY